MNVYVIQNRENSNYLTYRKNKWSDKLNNAQIFTKLSEARKERKKIKNDSELKLEIVPFELMELPHI